MSAIYGPRILHLLKSVEEETNVCTGIQIKKRKTRKHMCSTHSLLAHWARRRVRPRSWLSFRAPWSRHLQDTNMKKNRTDVFVIIKAKNQTATRWNQRKRIGYRWRQRERRIEPEGKKKGRMKGGKKKDHNSLRSANFPCWFTIRNCWALSKRGKELRRLSAIYILPWSGGLVSL